ncbi:MAG TPA: cofactor-independent phosphoglycerate mutase [Atribacteraceae bacterium]|nr:cofactor-independent phosphoglycerate mutase [Atribacteraceae bacterium]
MILSRPEAIDLFPAVCRVVLLRLLVLCAAAGMVILNHVLVVVKSGIPNASFRKEVTIVKYIVILGDGMADYPILELDGRTPLEEAHTPCIDSLAEWGVLGLVKTIPDDLPAGSDVANLSVLGYDPHLFYSGRSPFEAASMGIDLQDEDIVFRVNLITLTEEKNYRDKTILDHSAGEISTEEGKALIELINQELGRDGFTFYPGLSYRHLLVWNGGPDTWDLTPPHDILGRVIGDFLPKGEYSEVFLDIMQRSGGLLQNHPLNRRREDQGLYPANSIWIWGEGKKPSLQSFPEKYGVRGSVISEVDLIKGLGICAGLESINVPGATGDFHTNYRGLATAALQCLQQENDFVFVHIEAPDECSHRNELSKKVRSIELIDREVVEVIVNALNQEKKVYSILFLPDHATPLSVRTHTRDAVPFLIFRSHEKRNFVGRGYSEKSALETDLMIPDGHRLMDYFLEKVPFSTIPVSVPTHVD